MKLLTRTPATFTFLIGKREREVLFAVLKRYPAVMPAHFKGRSPAKHAPDHQQLLQEALAEQQSENRRQLESMLLEQGRFAEDELGFRFKLSVGEVEWLLQVLNDIRVGSWVQLGEPDFSNPEALMRLKLDEKTVHLAWAMEMAGHFQHILLRSLDDSEAA